MEETPAAEKLLKKILELQESQENLQREMSRLKVSAETKRPQRRPRRNRGDGTALWRKSHGAGKFTDNQYLNMLQSMAQAVHVIDLNGLIIFWNSMAEKLYGFSTSEALGKDPIDILVEGQDTAVADNITLRCRSGESWTGEFPYKNKSGDRLSVVTTISPFYDHAGSLVGIICISNDSSVYHLPSTSFSAGMNGVVSKLGFGSQQPIPADIASKISDLASKMGNKVRLKRAGDDSYQSDADQREDSSTSGASTPRGDFVHTPFGVFLRSDDKFCWNPSSDENDGNSVIPKTFTTRAEEWIAKKGLPWPWKGRRHAQSVWPWVQNEQQQQEVHQSNSFDKFKPESQACEGNKHANKEVTGSWSPCINASSCVMDKVDTNRDCLDYEILWEDLTIKEKMGQGSCGTVYSGLWFGSEVAVKVFPKQEYPDEIITSFRQEVSLMKRLRHPNVLLFMGAVASPQRLCIVTEFLPRGSLFGLLKRNTSKLDWRRRIRVALDIARGMNYLHHCSPPIIHRDLKSSNLLVDRNWTVKVADFGLSRIKHATYLTTKTGRGTPQWMAPEVLRNEAADEKSDVYSFGVILWELVTEKIPWENLNAMQVIGSVGFMNQRLEVPNDVDPQWISLMESCWDSEPQHRPSFKELMEKLRELQRKYTKELQAASVDNSSVKEK